MALTNDQITAQNFKDFYAQIRPYLNGNAHAGFTPVGTVISLMGKTAPLNYLICDGTVYNIADYPELAAYFAGQFEASNFFGGDGETTFAVPDLRGEFLRGSGTNSRADQGSGAEVGIHQDATEHLYLRNNGANGIVYGASTTYLESENEDSRIGSRKASVSTGAATSSEFGQKYTSRPTNTSVLYCISTKNIFMDAGNNYSTEEQVVGTWIDGKPIYQKTLTGTVSNISSVKRNPIGAAVETVVKIEGIYNNQQSLLGLSNDSFNESLNAVVISNSSASVPNTYAVYDKPSGKTTYVGKPYIMTIQYTKTTD